MLPPGFTQQRFDAVLAAFRAVVGDDWLFSSEEDMHSYRDFYSPYWGEDMELRAAAAVAPATAEEVQKIVRIASEQGVPLYPFSTGRNLGYGGSAPNYSGSVALDLKRMNRIIEIDERRGFVLVEPGVTYFELYEHIRQKGLKLWIDCPDPAWGSLIGNALDHGMGYSFPALRDHFGAHCGMEVVLPNGELMRTGMGARDGAGSWQDYRYGFGPYIDGLFSQGNFGVVTKMGFWLLPAPEAALGATVSVPRYHDIIPLSDIMTRLENQGIFQGMPFFGSELFGMGAGSVSPDLVRLIANGGTPEQFDAVRQGRDFWTVRLTFIGPEKVVQAQWDHAQSQFAAIPGARFGNVKQYRFPLDDEQIAGLTLSPTDDKKPIFGIPSMEIFSIGARSPSNANPSHGHVWLSPVVPRTGESIIRAQGVLVRGMLKHGLSTEGTIPMPTTYAQRAYLMILGFLVRDDPAENRKMRDAMRDMIDLAAAEGFLEYRSHPIFQDQIMGQYDFNKNALLRFHETIKDAIDPRGIISPGRYGIWPKALRKDKA